MNGTSAAASAADISGATLWFYLAGHGRLVLSLLPHADLGFRKAGEVNDRTLTLEDGSTTYRIECSRRIAPAFGRFNVYAFADAAWRPRGAEVNEPFLLGATGRPEQLVRK
ncbi:MAG: hypothetical protein LAP38_25480 [Acidobacteriia bacterium]|nr:hypothetical protein [Terriglobia bacterium]